MNDEVKKILEENMWDLATVSHNRPNVVPVAFKEVMEDGKLAVGDVFLSQTLKNLEESGGAIAISAYDAKKLQGYQVQGTASYIKEGPMVDKYKQIVESMFHGACTAKGVLIITPERIIVTTPRADNKKVLSV